MHRILVDACGWVAVMEAGINIDLALTECCGYKELAIVPSVISELEALNNPKLLVSILEKKALICEPPEDTGNHTDDQLYSLAIKNKWPVLTVDTELKRRLSQANSSWVEVSGRSHLRLVE